MKSIFKSKLILVKWHGISVGYLVYESKKMVTIAPHAGDISDKHSLQFCGEMYIPKDCIDKIEKLYMKEEK